MFEQSFLDEVKSRADCRELYESWGGIIKRNSAKCIKPTNHKNNDSNPSLVISPQSFKCMAPSCGITGDCFQLVREKLGINFNEAVFYVCAYYNITPPQLEKSEIERAKKEQKAEKKELVKIKKDKERAEIKKIEIGFLPDEITSIKEQPNYSKFCHEAHVKLLENKEAQAYLLSRGISMDTAKKCYLGYDTDKIIVPYTINYKIVYYTARSIKIKNNEKGDGKFYQPTGQVPCPMGFDNLRDNRIIYIAEGLFDYLTLVEKGYAAIGVPGSNAWKYSREWNSLLLGNKIMLCFHADEDGYKTNKLISSICQGLSVPYEIADWSLTRDKPTVKDLNDWVNNGGDIDTLFHNENTYTIQDIKTELSKLMDISNYDSAIDLVISVIVSNLMEGDPVWILLVGPPSVGKTELIRSVNNAVSTYFINRISPNTLTSGFTKTDSADVITRIVKSTTFCVTDFGSFLSFHPQDMQKVMQQLRDIYDGKVHVEYGNGKIIDWSGKVGILGGITPEIERHSGFIGRLGDRFLYYRMAIPEEKRTNIALRALSDGIHEESLRKKIKEVTDKFIDMLMLNIKEANDITIPDDIKTKIAIASDLFSRARTSIARMHDMEKTIEYKPEFEFIGRIARAFKVLIKALAFIRGRNEVNYEDYKVIRDICHGSIPSLRLEFLKGAYLLYLKDPNLWVSTSKFGEMIGKDTGTARYHLKNLLVLELMGIEVTGKDLKWKIKESTVSLIEGCDFFERPHEVNATPVQEELIEKESDNAEA